MMYKLICWVDKGMIKEHIDNIDEALGYLDIMIMSCKEDNKYEKHLKERLSFTFDFLVSINENLPKEAQQ